MDTIDPFEGIDPRIKRQFKKAGLLHLSNKELIDIQRHIFKISHNQGYDIGECAYQISSMIAYLEGEKFLNQNKIMKNLTKHEAEELELLTLGILPDALTTINAIQAQMSSEEGKQVIARITSLMDEAITKCKEEVEHHVNINNFSQ